MDNGGLFTARILEAAGIKPTMRVLDAVHVVDDLKPLVLARLDLRLRSAKRRGKPPATGDALGACECQVGARSAGVAA